MVTKTKGKRVEIGERVKVAMLECVQTSCAHLDAMFKDQAKMIQVLGRNQEEVSYCEPEYVHGANGCLASLEVLKDPGFLGVLKVWSVNVTVCVSVSGANAPESAKMEWSGERESAGQASSQTGVAISVTDGRSSR